MMIIELIFSKLAIKIKKDKRVKHKDGLVRNLEETEEIDLSKELRLQLHLKNLKNLMISIKFLMIKQISVCVVFLKID